MIIVFALGKIKKYQIMLLTYSTICDTIISRGDETVELYYKKQPRKYLESVDEPTRRKLLHALNGLKNLSGNIVKLAGHDNLYRLKIEHYRVIFSFDGDRLIIIEAIDTRTNIKYGRF